MGISMKILSFAVACGLAFVLFGLYAGTPTLAKKGDSAMGPEIHGKQESPYQINSNTQTGGGTYNPQVQGVGRIETKGDFNMGSSDKQGDTRHDILMGISMKILAVACCLVFVLFRPGARIPTLANVGDRLRHGIQSPWQTIVSVPNQLQHTVWCWGRYPQSPYTVGGKRETKGNFNVGSSDKQGDTSFTENGSGNKQF